MEQQRALVILYTGNELSDSDVSKVAATVAPFCKNNDICVCTLDQADIAKQVAKAVIPKPVDINQVDLVNNAVTYIVGLFKPQIIDSRFDALKTDLLVSLLRREYGDKLYTAVEAVAKHIAMARKVVAERRISQQMVDVVCKVYTVIKQA